MKTIEKLVANGAVLTRHAIARIRAKQKIEPLSDVIVLDIFAGDQDGCLVTVPKLGRDFVVLECEIREAHPVRRVEIDEQVLEETDGYFGYQDTALLDGHRVRVLYAMNGMVFAEDGPSIVARPIEAFTPLHAPHAA